MAKRCQSSSFEAKTCQSSSFEAKTCQSSSFEPFLFFIQFEWGFFKKAYLMCCFLWVNKENYLFYFRMMAKRVPKFQNLEGIQIFYVVSNFDVFFFFELIMIRTSGGFSLWLTFEVNLTAIQLVQKETLVNFLKSYHTVPVALY